MTRRAQARPQIKPLEPGRRVADRYIVHRIIGEGGMGQVVEVEHISLGRRFALKVLRLSRWNDELVRRFNREARALAKLSTPRVAQVTDFGIDDQTGPFYVMELLEGETLEEKLERDVKLTPRHALTVCAELCDALADVHSEGIVHRDLKPSNVGLPSKGPVGVKLLDFGLAASMDEAFLSKITQSQQILGSLPYMAPEQFNAADPASTMDLYAVGIVLYECLTGRLPFMAPTTAALIHQILATPVPPLPPEVASVPMVEALLEQLLAKDPLHRFSSATAAAGAIRDVLSQLGGGALHPATRALQSDMPLTMEASAPDASPHVGHMPTLMAESGMRLSGVPETPPEGSRPYRLPPGEVPPTPLAGTPIRHYPPAAPIQSAVQEPPTSEYPRAPGMVSLSTAPVAPPVNPWPMRIVIVTSLGMVFAGLTALVVAIGLTFLDNHDTRTPNVSEPAQPITAQVPEPAPAPQPIVPTPPPMEPHQATAPPEGPSEIEPEPVSPREVEEEVHVPRSTQQHGRRRGQPPPEPVQQPHIRTMPPQNSGSARRGQSSGVIREW